jgi:hypothetical protein
MTGNGNGTSRSELLLPLGVIIALLANSVIVGVGWGRMSQNQETQQESLSEIKKIVQDQGRDQTSRDNAQEKRLFDLEVAWRLFEKDLLRTDREAALLKDYTEGRISHLPYRPRR